MKHQHILDAIQNGTALNHGQKYSPFMTITDPAEAQAYLKALVAYHQAQVSAATPADAEYIERTNLTYFSGYYNTEVTHRVTGVLAQMSLLDDLHSQLTTVRDLLTTALNDSIGTVAFPSIQAALDKLDNLLA